MGAEVPRTRTREAAEDDKGVTVAIQTRASLEEGLRKGAQNARKLRQAADILADAQAQAESEPAVRTIALSRASTPGAIETDR